MSELLRSCRKWSDAVYSVRATGYHCDDENRGSFLKEVVKYLTTDKLIYYDKYYAHSYPIWDWLQAVREELADRILTEE